MTWPRQIDRTLTTPRRGCALAVAIAISVVGIFSGTNSVHAQSAFDDLFAPPGDAAILEPLPPLNDPAIAHLTAGDSPRGGGSSFGNQISPGGVSAVVTGQAVPTGGFLSTLVDGSPADLDKRLPFDAAAAKDLLAQAGYKDGFEVDFACSNNAIIQDEELC